MKRALCLVSIVAVLAVLVTLAGCGSDDSGVSAVDTAAKPTPPPPPTPVGPASGEIYYSDWYAGTIIRINWDGTQETVLPHSPVVADSFTVADLNGTRFILYDDTVASWPSKYGDMQPIVNVFAVPEGGGTPVNIVNDNHFQAWTPCVSVDGAMVAINGAGYWSEELQDFDPATIGSYVADVVYTSGMPTGVANLRMVCSTLLGSLSPDKTRAAVAEGVSGGNADVWVTLVSNGMRTNITNTSTLSEGSACWSPSTSVDRIAFAHPLVSKKGRVEGSQVYTVLPSGAGSVLAVAQANSGVTWNSSPSWSPNASQIAFVAQKTSTGAAAIMRTAADGTTTAAPVTGFTIGRAHCLTWLP